MKRWTLITVVCLASFLPLSAVAPAAIVFTDGSKVVYTSGGRPGGSWNQDMDFNRDGAMDFYFTYVLGNRAIFSPFVNGENRILATKAPLPDLEKWGTSLESGDMIGINTPRGEWWSLDDRINQYDYGAYLYGAGGAVSSVPFGEEFFLGVELHLEDGLHYGWIALEFRFAHLGEIRGWAYETEPGVPIRAGAIPEPSATLLTGSAALALAQKRRRWRTK